MTHDPLQQLLSRADAIATTPSPAATADLARHVRVELHRRQVRTRIAGVGAVTAALLVIAITLSFRPTRPTVTTNVPTTTISPTAQPAGPTPAQLRQQIATLRTEADAREAAVNTVLARQAHRRATVRATLPDPLAQIAAERDIGALALVKQADRRYRQTNHPNRTAAATAYARVVQLFPNTHGAAVAQQRLAAIGG